MIIFVNEDDAYRAWLAAHPRGLVVNARRKPTARYLVLHKATCPEVSAPRRHLTSGPYIKVCAHIRAELAEWAAQDVGGALRICEQCQPHGKDEDAVALPIEEHPHLTRMGERLLSYVLELAVISLDRMGDYAAEPPTVEKLASYFEKTIPQLEPIVRRLLEDGYILVGNESSPEVRLGKHSILYPTPAALRTVPAFADASDQDLQQAIESLRVPAGH